MLTAVEDSIAGIWDKLITFLMSLSVLICKRKIAVVSSTFIGRIAKKLNELIHKKLLGQCRYYPAHSGNISPAVQSFNCHNSPEIKKSINIF